MSRLRHHGLFLAAGLAACVILFGAYANHFENGFHFDDNHVIVNNLYLRSLHNAARFFTDTDTFSTRPENALYRPLLTLIYALDYWAGGGLHPFAFHRTQFALLVLVGVVLVALYRRLLDAVEPHPAHRYVALVAATLFCVHTANTETVNYLSSRSDIIATLGVVSALLLYVGWPRGRASCLYLLPVLLGGLAKPLTATFAPLLLTYRLLFEERLALRELGSRRGRRKLGAALLAALPALAASVAVVLSVWVMETAAVRYSDTDRISYLRTQGFVWLHYFRLFLLPTGLTADTDWAPLETWYDRRLFIGVLFVGLLSLAFARLAAAPRTRPVAFGLAWFAITLLPTSSVFPLAEVSNEHRIFLPYVGLTLATVGLAAVLLARLRPPRAAAGLAALLSLALLFGHGAATHERNRVWKDELSLWEDVTRKSPKNGRGLMNYGVALMGSGYVRQALGYFERAHVQLPNYDILEINLAIAKSALDVPGAEPHFLRALSLSPDYARGRYFFANWLVGEGRAAEAIEQIETALDISPGDLEARSLLARLYAASGDDERLDGVVRGTLAIANADPTARAYAEGREPLAATAETPQAYAALGRRHASAGFWLDAACAFRRAVALDPRSAPAWNDLGRARLELGFVDEAALCFEKALAIERSAP